jgi:putative oxidoreductase
MFQKIAIWTFAILLGVFFVLVGFSKIAGPAGLHWAVRLSHWGYPAASRYIIGSAEILAGLGLFVPSFRRSATIVLMIVLGGALFTHLIHAEYVRLLPPLILAGLLFGLCSWQRSSSLNS